MKSLSTFAAASLAAVSALLILVPHVAADSWSYPQKEHWSANELWVLKVGFGKEGDSLSLWERTDDGLTQHWRRGYVNRAFPPLRAYVTDNGKHVVLRDLHFSVGHGEVIVILGGSGNILERYELSEFLPQDEINRAQRTVSSLWWSENAWFSFINDQQQFALATQLGTVRSFDLSSGRLLDLTEERRGRIVDLVRQDAEHLVESEKTGNRIRGVTLLGAMGIDRAIPTAKTLFHDRTRTGSAGGGGLPSGEIYGVQQAAALALVRLMGTNSIPIIEAELHVANGRMQHQLMGVLERVAPTDSATVTDLWQRLAKHPSDHIRKRAYTEFLKRVDESYLLSHPDLLTSESDIIRRITVGRLATIEAPEATALLRKAISDNENDIRHLALRHLIDRDPPDIERILLPCLDDQDHWIRITGISGLVCRGSPVGIEKLRETIESDREVEIGRLCKLIADLKVHEAKESLARVRSDLPPHVVASATGALAALGDEQALDDLHKVVAEGDLTSRCVALEMCRYLYDEKSVALVKEAAEGDQVHLRSAVTRELDRFEDKRK